MCKCHLIAYSIHGTLSLPLILSGPRVWPGPGQTPASSPRSPTSACSTPSPWRTSAPSASSTSTTTSASSTYAAPRMAGQFLSSMNDSIPVFSGPEYVLTSTLRRSHGGAICDFSIGVDRLFALHEENVFDVWETPPPPII
ncbi:hypothetical protein BS78_08G029400 [Paspalum vaginatum]|nr:hypothetical protein BS78_08G029400 [Paspalum vaginatum]